MGRCGILGEGVSYLEKSIEVESQFFSGNNSVVTGLRKLLLGSLYEQFQMWTEAAELNEVALTGIPDDLTPQKEMANIHCSHLGYCNTKLKLA